jgi:hypothetical protein
MKYLHTLSERVAMPKKHDIRPRIQAQIDIACAWYYQRYYPQTGRVDRRGAAANPGIEAAVVVDSPTK